MSDLVAFLNARLDEDEQAVRAVLGVNVMAGLKGGKPAPRWVPSPKADGGIWDTDGIPRVKFVWARERDHIIRHNPARVLAEVEAKRRIVAIHGPQSEYGVVYCQGCGFGNDGEFYMPVDECPEKRALAAVHAEHPDYRQEWAV